LLFNQPKRKTYYKSSVFILVLLIFASLSTFEFALAYTVTYTEQLPDIPEAIEFDLNNGNAYTMIPNNASIQILDGQNNTVTNAINLFDRANNSLAIPTDIAFNPNNGDMYVTTQTYLYNFTDDTVLDNCARQNTNLRCLVYVIDAQNNTVIDTIPIGGRPPVSIAFNPNNGDMYVSHLRQTDSRTGTPATVSVIDYQNNTVIDVIDIGRGRGELKIDFNPKNEYTYIINQGFGIENGSAGTVLVIDDQNNTVIDTVPVGVLPFVIGSNPNNGEMYIGNQESRTVSVIDDQNNTVIDTISINGIPNDIAFNPNNGDMYVTNSYPDIVSIIDERNNTVIGNIPLKIQTLNIDFNPVNEKMYVSNNINNTIAIIETT
jgi:YVTN family beta-propeller protein